MTTLRLTPAEIAAYNAGLSAAVELATRCADAMRARTKIKPTRYPFATAALDAMTEEVAALALPMPAAGAAQATQIPYR